MTAQEFAIQAHGDQRYGDFPYATHLQSVVSVLDRFDVAHPDIVTAAWLHDVLEDTPTQWLDICENFGSDVADLVWAVTNQPGANRRIRAAHTYPKIRTFAPHAVIVKVADRIANTEHAIRHETRHLEMYQREYPAFRYALYNPGECDAMWQWLLTITESGDL